MQDETKNTVHFEMGGDALIRVFSLALAEHIVTGKLDANAEKGLYDFCVHENWHTFKEHIVTLSKTNPTALIQELTTLNTQLLINGIKTGTLSLLKNETNCLAGMLKQFVFSRLGLLTSEDTPQIPDSTIPMTVLKKRFKGLLRYIEKELFGNDLSNRENLKAALSKTPAEALTDQESAVKTKFEALLEAVNSNLLKWYKNQGHELYFNEIINNRANASSVELHYLSNFWKFNAHINVNGKNICISPEAAILNTSPLTNKQVRILIHRGVVEQIDETRLALFPLNHKDFFSRLMQFPKSDVVLTAWDAWMQAKQHQDRNWDKENIIPVVFHAELNYSDLLALVERGIIVGEYNNYSFTAESQQELKTMLAPIPNLNQIFSYCSVVLRDEFSIRFYISERHWAYTPETDIQWNQETQATRHHAANGNKEGKSAFNLSKALSEIKRASLKKRGRQAEGDFDDPRKGAPKKQKADLTTLLKAHANWISQILKKQPMRSDDPDIQRCHNILTGLFHEIAETGKIPLNNSAFLLAPFEYFHIFFPEKTLTLPKEITNFSHFFYTQILNTAHKSILESSVIYAQRCDMLLQRLPNGTYPKVQSFLTNCKEKYSTLALEKDDLGLIKLSAANLFISADSAELDFTHKQYSGLDKKVLIKLQALQRHEFVTHLVISRRSMRNLAAVLAKSLSLNYKNMRKRNIPTRFYDWFELISSDNAIPKSELTQACSKSEMGMWTVLKPHPGILETFNLFFDLFGDDIDMACEDLSDTLEEDNPELPQSLQVHGTGM